MKFRKSDFLAAPDAFLKVEFDYSDPKGVRFANTPVLAVPECHVEGILHFDGRSRVISDLHYQGIMTLADSITGEDVDIEFETESEKEYSFDPVDEEDEAEDVIRVFNDTIDLGDEAAEAIVYEAPMSITRLAREEYPQGKGWVLVSDQDEPASEPEEDPRWAKLKEFNFEDN